MGWKMGWREGGSGGREDGMEVEGERVPKHANPKTVNLLLKHVHVHYNALTHCLPLLLVLVKDGELELCPHVLVFALGPRDQHEVERDVVSTLIIQTTGIHTKTPERWEGGREGGRGEGEERVKGKKGEGGWNGEEGSR